MSAIQLRRKIPTPGSTTDNVFSPRLGGGYRTTPGRSQLNVSSLSQNNTTYSFAGSGSTERCHSLQDYGNPMPVLISEALNITEKLAEYTVKIDASGWAWLVGGRKLFIWRYNQSSHEKSSRIVKELTLPPSDLAHDADRVCVIPSPRESQQAACVAVSPEGVVRYWSSIAHEAAFVEISAELKGEECSCVVNLQPYGCILATTTSSFVLLTPVSGQNSITCHMIRASQGMLAGITRKMSSFIFGSSPAQASGAALHALVASDDCYEYGEDRFFYVLTGDFLQKWSVATGNTEMLLYQSDVQRLFRTHLAKKIWNQDVARLPQFQTWLLDMQPTSDGVVVLAAAMNAEVGNTVYYAIGVIAIEDLNDEVDFETVIVLEHVETWQDSAEDTLLGYHLLVADTDGDEAIVYNKSRVHCISLNGLFPSESVDFSRLTDRILGVGRFSSNPLLFSAHRGILLVNHISNEQKLSVEDTEGMLDMEETVGASDSTQGIFTSAFVAFCHKKTKKAEELLMKIFPTQMSQDFEMDRETAKTLPAQSTELDQIVAQTSLSIVDDYPSADPRWAESKNATPDLGYKSSNLILKQLEKKLNLHEMFNKFLRFFNLTDKLNSIPVRDVLMDTTMFMCENAEKVAAMIAIRSSEQDYKFLEEMSLLPTIIKRVADKRGETTRSLSLTHLDLFYREVSGVQDIFTESLEYENDHLTADMNPKHIVNLIVTMNDLILYVLGQVMQYRLNKRSYYARFSETNIQTEYIPWTCSIGRLGMRALLKKQCSMTLEQGIINAQDHNYQARLFNHLTDLADILLDGYSCQLTSLEVYDNKSSRYNQLCKMYEEDRETLISMLMDHKEYEKAASLAEKYYDFITLAKVCDITEDEDRFQRYCNIFAHKGFRESMYHYYLRTGKRAKLLTMPLTLELSLVLNKCKSLSWLMDVESQNYYSSYETLSYLANEEKKYVSRKKTVLAMAKLCLLSTEREVDDHLLPAINTEQELITHQELIPPEVLHSMGMDPDDMRVLQPHEMVELYIHDENIHATEYHFKMALDLLPFVAKKEPEIDLQDLFLHIWCKAVLRNNWSRRFDDPVEDYSSKLFYKIILLANSQHAVLSEIVPDKSLLLAADELSHLQSDDNFNFLIETIYEQIINTM